MWEGVGDRTELQHIDHHFYGHQRCVFLVLQGCSTGGPGAHSTECGLSPPHLVSNSSDLQLTDFLSSPSYIIIQSPTQSLEWHVWSSSSGNNCHAVHRSLSSGTSVYECTMGFYLVPYRQPSPPTQFLLITAIGMCHFLPVHHFGMACLAGSKVNIQQMYNCVLLHQGTIFELEYLWYLWIRVSSIVTYLRKNQFFVALKQLQTTLWNIDALLFLIDREQIRHPLWTQFSHWRKFMQNGEYTAFWYRH